MSAKIYEPLHYAISVSDIDAAIVWFEDVLNFKLLSKSEILPMGFKTGIMDNGSGFQVEIFEPRQAKPLPEERLLPDTDNMVIGNKHLAFLVDDLDEVVKGFIEKNIEFAKEPFRIAGLYCTFIYGPDKVLMEFVEKIS